MFGMAFDRRGLTLAAITLVSAVTLMALYIGVFTLVSAIILISSINTPMASVSLH